jgi:hypothetical protein
LLLKWRFKSLSYPKTLLQSMHLNSLKPCAAFLWATRDCLWQYLLSQSVHVYCFSWKKSWKSVFNRYIYIQFWRVPLLEQELLTLPEHLSSPPIFGAVCVAQFLVFCVVLGELLLDFFILVILLSVFIDFCCTSGAPPP